MRLIDKAMNITDGDEKSIMESCCPITMFGPEAVDRHFDINNCENAECEDCWEQHWRE
jgi:hypothetical protein